MMIFRGSIYSVSRGGGTHNLVVHQDGCLAVRTDGRISYCGDFKNRPQELYGVPVIDKSGQLMLPSFVDSHLHAPQLTMIGCLGEDLIGWLNRYTFPFETRFNNQDTAQTTSKTFFDELKRNGISASVAFSSSNMVATDMLFSAADHSGLKAIIGKVSMNRHAPEELLVDTAQDLEETKELIQRWHNKHDRLHYALTPRFSPSCTQSLLNALGELKQSDPSLYMQTHLSEQADEVAWVKDLFPKAKDYYQTYEDAGLCGPRSLFAHAVHVTEDELTRMREDRAAIVHCPSSNLFLGSGLFPWEEVRNSGVPVIMASDVGGGFTLSPWRNMMLSYTIQKTRGHAISPEDLFYAYTGEAANTLSLNAGELRSGLDADFQIIDPKAVPLLQERLESANDDRERLGALIALGDDRLTQALYVKGRCVYDISKS